MNRRSLTDDMAEDMSLAKLGITANLVFDRLITITDDAGLCTGEPAMVKGKCFPLMDDISTASIGKAINDLVRAEMLYRRDYRGRVVLSFKPDSFQKLQKLRQDYKRKFSYGDLSQLVWDNGLHGFRTDPNGSAQPVAMVSTSVSTSVTTTESTTEVEDSSLVCPDVESVLNHYGKAYEPVISSNAKTIIIQAMLKHFTVEQLCQAIDGTKHDTWPKRKDNRGIQTIFKTVEQVEKFIALGQRIGLSAADIEEMGIF